jgi:signal transduction histidine kinase
VAAAERSRIFQKFVRGAAAASSGASGTGLGLALVDLVMRAHGGRVQLESEPGRGSTFSLVLPAPPDEGAGATDPVAEARPR